jgi:outer membrane receptor protein involved in Fe transport
VGFDARDIRGETREDYSYANGDYADRRFAGGGQSFLGAFALREQPVAAGLRLSLGVRLDRWEQFGGHLRQWVRTTGAALGDSEYPGREGVEFSPSAGATWQLAGGWKLHADVQQGFRVPTLNELYRPFRQGNNVTEANPALQAEHATSGEIGVDWTSGSLKTGLAGFASELRDAVDAVTIATGPANVPGIGAIAAGGSALERLNLDLVRVGGVQAYAEWKAGTSWRIRADCLFDDTDIVRASVAPALVGNQLVEVPRESATLEVNWSGPGGLVIAPRLRWTGVQYVDDQNLLPLTAVAVVDLTVSRAFGPYLRVFLTAENLGNATVETALSTTGVINTGTPRLIFGGIRFDR